MKAPRLWKQNENSLAFQGGVLFFLIGILGLLYWYTQTRIFALEDFWDASVEQVVEVQDLGAIDPASRGQMIEFAKSAFVKDFPSLENLDFVSLFAPHGARAQFPDGEVIWAFESRSRSKILEALGGLLLKDETFRTMNFPKGELFTPDFSSPFALAFSGKWVFLAQSSDRLKAQFESTHKLSKEPLYNGLFKDLPAEGIFQVYLNTEKWFDRLGNAPEFAEKQPIFQAFSQSVRSLGVSGDLKQGDFEVATKLMTHEGVFERQKLLKDSDNTLVPELASFVGDDAFLFMTGHDFYQKYQHTQDFLSQINPQFGVIFDGLLRAKSREIFGEDFDFEKDFLAHMYGQYGVLVDQSSPSEGISYVFITGFGGADKNESLEHLQQALKSAQSRLVTQIETVELPDGTVRQELVSVNPGDLPIRKVETPFGPYYRFKDEKEVLSFSFGFFNGFLAFSTSDKAMDRIVSALGGKLGKLSENNDFRDFVLFRSAPSESYGFINPSKLQTLLAGLENDQTSFGWRLLGPLSEKVRNIAFSRRVYPGEVFTYFTFFSR